MKLKKKLVVLDLETTGIWVEKDKIIEIALIKCYENGNKSIYEKRVNPGIPIPKNVSELIGISDKDIKNSPFFKDIADEVISFIEDADLAGFNIERFDLPLLSREINECGKKLNMKGRKVYDVQKIFHLNEKRDLSAALKFYCDKELTNAHAALADTEATLDILEEQVKRYSDGDESLSSLDRFDYETKIEFYGDENKFRWWNGKLYMMFGKYAKRYSLQEVVKKDPKYLEWILSANFNQDVKNLVEDALNDHYPQPPEIK